MDILTQSAFILSAVSFAFGASVFTRNMQNKLFIAFASFAILVAVWSMSFFLDSIFGPGIFYRWHLFFQSWLAFASLALIQIFARIQDSFTNRIRDLSLFFALSGSITVVFELDEIPWVRVVLWCIPFLVSMQIFYLMWIDRRLRYGLKRLPKMPTIGFAKRNFIYWGALLAITSASMDHFNFTGRTWPAVGNILLSVYIYFLSQAVLQQRLINFGALVSRFFILVVFALTMTGLYTLLVAWVADRPPLFFLNSFIASFLLLMLLDPIRTMTRYLTERLLTQHHLRLKKVLEESQRTLAGIVDPQALFLNILQTTQQVLQPQWIGLYLQRSDGTKFRRVRSEGLEPDPILSEILIESPLFEYARTLKNRDEPPILLDQVFENELDRSTSQTQREHWNQLSQGLKALGGSLMIPLFDGDIVLGFIIVKVDRPPEPWGSNWGLLSIIYPYYEQATQTLRSLEVYVRQREKERLAALGEMAAGLAHEIRNPLGAIKGAAQFLDPSQNRPESAFLKVIIEETDRLNRVVSQFLDYSKPASIGFESIDLNHLIKRTVENARLGIPSNIELCLELPKFQIRVEIVPEQIQQVILNLIHNAVKALANVAEPKILIELSKVSGHSSTDSSAVIVVEDNGAGIARENIEKIFIPFFTTSTQGTGLGLSICQKIVEAHNGHISVASDVSRFTRFTVILPISKNTKKEYLK